VNAPRLIEVSADDLKLLAKAMEDNWYRFQYHDNGDEAICIFCYADQEITYNKYGQDSVTKEHHKPDCPLLVARAIKPKEVKPEVYK
jgi:hypothetical protein